MPLEPVRSELHITLIRVGRREGGEQGGGGGCPVKLRWISLFSILNMYVGWHPQLGFFCGTFCHRIAIISTAEIHVPWDQIACGGRIGLKFLFLGRWKETF